MFGRSNVQRLTAQELAARIKVGAPTFLLDVRNPQELITAGSVPGVVNIPLSQLESRLVDLPADKSAPIVVICQSGARSMSAAKLLDKAGYREVYNLEGGTSAWMRTSGTRAL